MKHDTNAQSISNCSSASQEVATMVTQLPDPWLCTGILWILCVYSHHNYQYTLNMFRGM